LPFAYSTHHQEPDFDKRVTKLPFLRAARMLLPVEGEERTYRLPPPVVTAPTELSMVAAFAGTTGITSEITINKVRIKVVNFRIFITSVLEFWHICKVIIQ
jgi:hypothetical protein